MYEEQVTVVARFTAKSGSEDTLKAELLALVEPTRDEAGCINYDLHQDSDRPGEFVFYENFVDMPALETHAAMPYLKRLLDEIVPALCETPPVITTWTMISEKAH